MKLTVENSPVYKILNGNPIITFDTETTGVDEKSEIIQIGYSLSKFNSKYEYFVDEENKNIKIVNYLKITDKNILKSLKTQYEILLDKPNISNELKNKLKQKLELLNKKIVPVEKIIPYTEKVNETTFKIDENTNILLDKKLPLFLNNNNGKYKPVFGMFGSFENLDSGERKFGYKNFLEPKALIVHKLFNRTLLKKQFENKKIEEVIDYYKQVIENLDKKLDKKEKKDELNKLKEIEYYVNEVNKLLGNIITSSFNNNLDKILEYLKKSELIDNKQFEKIKIYIEKEKNKNQLDFNKLKSLILEDKKEHLIDMLGDFLKRQGFIEYKETATIDEAKTRDGRNFLLAFKELINGEHPKFNNIINVGQNLIFDINQLNKYLDEENKFTNYFNVFDTMFYDMELNQTKSKKSLDTFVNKGFETTIKEIKKEVEDLIKELKKEIKDKELKKELQIIADAVKKANDIDKINEIRVQLAEVINKYDLADERLIYIKLYIEEMNKLYKWQKEREFLHDALLDVKLTEEMAVRYLLHQTIEKHGLKDPFEIKKLEATEKISDKEIEKYKDKIKVLPGIKTQYTTGTFSKIENVLDKIEKDGYEGLSISDKLITNMYNDYQLTKERNIKNIFSVDVTVTDYNMPISIMFKDKKAWENAKLYIEHYKLTMDDLQKILDNLNVAIAIPPEFDNILKHEKVFIKVSPNIPYDYDNAKFNNKRILWIENKYINKDDKLSYYIYRNVIDNSLINIYKVKAIALNKDEFADKEIPTKEKLLTLFPYEKYKDIYENANQIFEETEHFDPRPNHIDLFPSVKKIMKKDIKLETPKDYRKYLEKLVNEEREKNKINTLIKLRVLSDVLKNIKKEFDKDVMTYGEAVARKKWKEKINNEKVYNLIFNRNIDNMNKNELQFLIKELPKEIKKDVDNLYNKYLKLFNDRVEDELNALEKFPNYKLVFTYYFLIYKIIDVLKQHNIYPGPGRGSAAGSVLLYILGVTEIDPTSFNLLFERFLNPDRVSLPDVDVDVSIRDVLEEILGEYFKVLPEELKEKLLENSDVYEKEIIEDIVKKYEKGEKELSPIAKIGTVTLLSEKVLMFDFLRLLGIPFNKIEEARKYWEEDKDLITNFINNPVVKENFTEDFIEIFKQEPDILLSLIKMVKNFGIHAGGIRIFDIIKDQILKDGNITSTDKNDPNNEAKMDLLGLKTLLLMYSVIEDVTKEEEKIKIINQEIRNSLTDEERTKLNNFINMLNNNLENNNVFEPQTDNDFYTNINEIVIKNKYETLPEILKEHFENNFLTTKEKDIINKIKQKFPKTINVYLLDNGNYLIEVENKNIILDNNLNKIEEISNIQKSNNEIIFNIDGNKEKVKIVKDLKEKPKMIFKYIKNLIFIKYSNIVTKKIKHLTFDDENVFHLLNQKLTASVFQVESEHLTNLLQDLHVMDFETLIAAIALYRPGPIMTGDLDKYIVMNNLKLKNEFINMIKNMVKKGLLKIKNINELTIENLKDIYNSSFFPKRYKKFINFNQFVNIMNTDDYYSLSTSSPFYTKIDNKLKEVKNLLINKYSSKINNNENITELLKEMENELERELEEVEKLYIAKSVKEGKILNTTDILKEVKNIELTINNNKFFKEITSDTNNIIVYQEQIMKLSRALAQFTKGEADALRKVIAKSKKDQILKFAEPFIKGATQDKIALLEFEMNNRKFKLARNSEYEYELNGINLRGTKIFLKDNIIEINLESKYKDEIINQLKENNINFNFNKDGKLILDKNKLKINEIQIDKGLPENVARYLFDSIVGFGSYAFNKSHAAAYAAITYETAMQKFYYPEIFYKNALKYSSIASIQQIIAEMTKNNNIAVDIANINDEVSEFLVNIENKVITFPLSVIKNVKEETIKIIDIVNNKLKQNNQKYHNILDLLFEIPNLDKSTFVQLGRSGILKDISIINFNGKNKLLTQKFYDKFGNPFFDTIKKYLPKHIENIIKENLDKLKIEDTPKNIAKNITKYLKIKKDILTNEMLKKEIEELRERDKILREKLGSDEIKDNDILKLEKEKEEVNLLIKEKEQKIKEINESDLEFFNKIEKDYKNLFKLIKNTNLKFDEIETEFNKNIQEYNKKEEKKAKDLEKFEKLSIEEAKQIIENEEEYDEEKLKNIKYELLKEFFVNDTSITVHVIDDNELANERNNLLHNDINNFYKETFGVEVPKQQSNPASLLIISDDLNKYIYPEIDGLYFDSYKIERKNKDFEYSNKYLMKIDKINSLEFSLKRNRLELNQEQFEQLINRIKNYKMDNKRKEELINKIKEVANSKIFVLYGINSMEETINDNIENITIDEFKFKKEKNGLYLKINKDVKLKYNLNGNKLEIDRIEIDNIIDNTQKEIKSASNKEKEKLNELLNKLKYIKNNYSKINILITNKLKEKIFLDRVNEIKTVYFDTENDELLKKEKRFLSSELKPDNVTVMIIPKNTNKQTRKELFDKIKYITENNDINLVFSVGVDSIKMLKENHEYFSKMSEFKTEYNKLYYIGHGINVGFLQNIIGKYKQLKYIDDKEKKIIFKRDIEKELKEIYINILNNIKVIKVKSNIGNMSEDKNLKMKQMNIK